MEQELFICFLAVIVLLGVIIFSMLKDMAELKLQHEVLNKNIKAINDNLLIINEKK